MPSPPGVTRGHIGVSAVFCSMALLCSTRSRSKYNAFEMRAGDLSDSIHSYFAQNEYALISKHDPLAGCERRPTANFVHGHLLWSRSSRRTKDLVLEATLD